MFVLATLGMCGAPAGELMFEPLQAEIANPFQRNLHPDASFYITAWLHALLQGWPALPCPELTF